MSMEEKTAKRLNWYYYGCYVLAVLGATLLWYLVTKQKIQSFEPQSTVGNVLQYIAIAYTLLSVPAGLYGFKRICNRIRHWEEEPKFRAYFKWAVVRILVIGLGILVNISAFYILRGYQSMLWCAAVSAVALFFCKPMPRKIQLELNIEEP